MAISKQSYKDLKEYWDYQRKVEYNKEMVHFMAEMFKGRVYNDFGMVHIDEMKELIKDLEMCHQPNNCAHGRPTVISIPSKLLEQEFHFLNLIHENEFHYTNNPILQIFLDLVRSSQRKHYI